jgi:hypothetical protein
MDASFGLLVIINVAIFSFMRLLTNNNVMNKTIVIRKVKFKVFIITYNKK